MERLTYPLAISNRFVRYVLGIAAVACLAGTASAGASNAVELKSTETTGSSAPEQSKTLPVPSMKNPQLIVAKDPDFPASMRVKGAKHAVSSLAFTVDTQGIPQNVHVIASAGKDFDENAMKAVRQYRFRPAEKDGKIIATDLKVDVDFQIF